MEGKDLERIGRPLRTSTLGVGSILLRWDDVDIELIGLLSTFAWYDRLEAD